MYVKLGRGKDAVDECRQAMALGDKDVFTVVSLGQAYEAAGDADNARAEYRLGLQMDPDGWATAPARSGLDRLGENAQ